MEISTAAGAAAAAGCDSGQRGAPAQRQGTLSLIQSPPVVCALLVTPNFNWHVTVPVPIKKKKRKCEQNLQCAFRFASIILFYNLAEQHQYDAALALARKIRRLRLWLRLGITVFLHELSALFFRPKFLVQ
jgi:hypothetical protein